MTILAITIYWRDNRGCSCDGGHDGGSGDRRRDSGGVGGGDHRCGGADRGDISHGILVMA